MIDFWELAGRLVLRDPDKRRAEIYDADTGLLPIQSDGCILLGHANSPALPFSAAKFYDPLRAYFVNSKDPKPKGIYLGMLQSPVVSMFALGEIGVMFFNQKFRDAFEDLSLYVRKSGRSDTGSAPLFYIVLALLVVDRTTRGFVATGDFQGLKPAAPADQDALQALANDKVFIEKADIYCFSNPWTGGSLNPLNHQTYGTFTLVNQIGDTNREVFKEPIPFRHFRFVPAP